MGFFGDLKERKNMNSLSKVRENALAHGLHEGTHQENCERCRHVVRGECATGLACSGRRYRDGSYLIVNLLRKTQQMDPEPYRLGL